MLISNFHLLLMVIYILFNDKISDNYSIQESNGYTTFTIMNISFKDKLTTHFM